jgi:hypothetical protein
MNRLSLKFIGGSLVMFTIAAIYTLYALFRVFLSKGFLLELLLEQRITSHYGFFVMFQEGVIPEWSAFYQLTQIISIPRLLLLLSDAVIIFSLMIILWYLVTRFFITPGGKYFRVFVSVLLLAVFYYLIPSFVVPKNFCENYNYYAICPSFCGIDIDMTQMRRLSFFMVQ